MPEDNPGTATLEAVLAEENLRAAWLAVKAAAGYVKEGKTWVVDIDLKKLPSLF